MTFKWRSFKNYRLMTKLIFTYMLLTVLPMSLIGYVAYSQYTKSIEEQVGEYIPKVLDQANESIDYYLADVKQLPDLLYNSNQVIEVLRKDSYQNKSSLLQDRFIVNSYLTRTYINGEADVLGAFILSKNRLFESSKIPYSGFGEDMLPFGQDLELKGKQSFLLPSQVPLSFKGNPPYILLMRQITDTENRMNLGTMFIAVDLSFMSNVVENLETVNNADLSLLSEEGQMIYHTDSEKIGLMDEEFQKYPEINGSFRTTGEEENRLISISRAGPDGWVLLHSVKLKNLTERTDLVRNATIIVFLVIILLGTLISVILAWTVSRPIHRLTHQMKEVEKGNFEVDVTSNSSDEIGMLAKSFHSMVAKIKDLIRLNYQIKLQQKEAELYALQSQINPHFMYNTLETIGMAVEEGENETVVDMVSILGRMLRFSISNKEKMVSIDQEVQHMKDYLTIQKIRFEDRIEFSIQDHMDTKRFLTPKFILQPIVENCMKHGLDHCHQFKVEIFIEIKDQEIHFTVKDNGPGINEDVMAELSKYLQMDPMGRRDSKFGLINVHGRITMMFGEQYGLRIESKGGIGTEVTIRIPLLPIDLLNEGERAN
jgi:two-component system, sensor histidine kinase YesM